MLDEGSRDLVVAFPRGRGTANMVRQTRVPVMVIAADWFIPAEHGRVRGLWGLRQLGFAVGLWPTACVLPQLITHCSNN
jgi:hypothetical protein